VISHSIIVSENPSTTLPEGCWMVSVNGQWTYCCKWCILKWMAI